jgi:thioredoxin reductase (NADPH)
MDYDLVIIGAGPAGLTAGIYASRSGLQTVILERTAAGGLVSTTDRIENFPGFPDGIKGSEIGERMVEQARRFGVEIVAAEVRGIERQGERYVVRAEPGEYPARAVVVAAGSHPKMLGVPGEKELRGRGVSYCAICDGPLFRDQVVAVVGGGNSGLQEGRFLLHFARQVVFIEFLPCLTADKILQRHFEKESRVKFLLNHQVISINGSETVESLTVRDRAAIREEKISAAGVFIYAGLVPNSGFVRSVANLDRDGFILTDDNLQTSATGIFACGDIRAKRTRQIVTACGEGAEAAMNAFYYIESMRGG